MMTAVCGRYFDVSGRSRVAVDQAAEAHCSQVQNLLENPVSDSAVRKGWRPCAT